MTYLRVLEKTMGKIIKSYQQLFFRRVVRYWEHYSNFITIGAFFHKKILSVEKPTRTPSTQTPDIFVTRHQGFKKNTGRKNSIVVDEQPSFTQILMSSM